MDGSQMSRVAGNHINTSYILAQNQHRIWQICCVYTLLPATLQTSIVVREAECGAKREGACKLHYPALFLSASPRVLTFPLCLPASAAASVSTCAPAPAARSLSGSARRLLVATQLQRALCPTPPARRRAGRRLLLVGPGLTACSTHIMSPCLPPSSPAAHRDSWLGHREHCSRCDEGTLMQAGWSGQARGPAQEACASARVRSCASTDLRQTASPTPPPLPLSHLVQTSCPAWPAPLAPVQQRWRWGSGGLCGPWWRASCGALRAGMRQRAQWLPCVGGRAHARELQGGPRGGTAKPCA